MSDTLKQLKTYNVETIHNKTRITPESIKALLEHDFTYFSKARFLGFVSIIEREFHVDLRSYKDEYTYSVIDSESILLNKSEDN